jgi:LuxR family transcriptional regulator, maltose regulon positive regulatory protein
MRARLWAAQGRLGDAFDWARSQGLSVEDSPSYLREFEHITLVRILLAQYRGDRVGHVIQPAVALLDRLRQAAEAGGRVRSVIEIRMLEALVCEAQGDLHAALAPLQQALALAEPEGYVRLFADEGGPMEQLLRAASGREGHAAYARTLLAAFETDRQKRGRSEALHPAPHVSQTLVTAEAQLAKTRLVEPLSQRELEVLRLFKTEQSGPEIARELVVALSTVRTHTKSIYSKLDVNTRRAAVRRGTELGLI